MDVRTVEKYVSHYYEEMLKSMFKGVSFKGRFHIERASDQWSKEDKSIWEMKKGKRADVYYIYFDGELMCDFEEDEPPAVVDKRFLQGFLEAYNEGKIYLNEGLADEMEKERKREQYLAQEAKRIKKEKDLAPLNADERQIAEIVLKEVQKKK